jgi:uncharacterized protein YpmS
MSSYEVGMWVMLGIIVCWLLLFKFSKWSFLRSYKVGFPILIALLAIFMVMTVASVIEDGNSESVKRCDAYCNCQITQNCSYTFDYNDVENCDCEVDK